MQLNRESLQRMPITNWCLQSFGYRLSGYRLQHDTPYVEWPGPLKVLLRKLVRHAAFELEERCRFLKLQESLRCRVHHKQVQMNPSQVGVQAVPGMT